MRTHPILLLTIGLTLAACDDSGGPSDGEPPTDGTLVVSTATGGSDPDQDGYLLTVDGVDSVALDPTGTAEVDLPEGHYTLRLLGVAEHCSVAPGTPLEVDVPLQDTTSVAFEVNCPVTGARITTTTTGLDLDPDGYRARGGPDGQGDPALNRPRDDPARSGNPCDRADRTLAELRDRGPELAHSDHHARRGRASRLRGRLHRHERSHRGSRRGFGNGYTG